MVNIGNNMLIKWYIKAKKHKRALSGIGQADTFFEKILKKVAISPIPVCWRWQSLDAIFNWEFNV
jgi:hypothetical protein